MASQGQGHGGAQQQQQQQQQQSGPPYPPSTALLGGVPTVKVDDPITAVLLFLFICSAVTHMTIFQLNRRRSHKFVFSALLFGFSMARITTLSLRLAWASHPTDVNVAIAAQIFVAAGVLLLFVVNLIFAQRVVRAYHPRLGWHRLFGLAFRLLYVSVVANLIMVITATVYAFFTLDPKSRSDCRVVQLVAGTFLAALAFAPIPVVLLAVLVPRRGRRRPDKFGAGSLRAKLGLLLFTSAVLALGAGFRVGVNFAPRPRSAPAWYHSRACYYVFNYVLELLVVFTYAAVRFDRRFHVPDGARGAGAYAATAGDKRASDFDAVVNTEEEMFGTAGDDDDEDTVVNSNVSDATAWEMRARKELKKAEKGEL